MAMALKTSYWADISPDQTLKVKAELFLLSLITIFGVAGLGLCFGIFQKTEDCAMDWSHKEPTEIVEYYDIKNKT